MRWADGFMKTIPRFSFVLIAVEQRLLVISQHLKRKETHWIVQKCNGMTMYWKEDYFVFGFLPFFGLWSKRKEKRKLKMAWRIFWFASNLTIIPLPIYLFTFRIVCVFLFFVCSASKIRRQFLLNGKLLHFVDWDGNFLFNFDMIILCVLRTN